MNSLMLYGTLLDEPKVHHEKYGCKIVTFPVKVARKSGSEDILNVMVSDRMIFGEVKVGDALEVSGEVRTYNSIERNKRNLKLYSYAYSVEKSKKNFHEDCTKNNTAVIEGFVCNKPEERTTATGRRISTILLAVPRKHDKSSYVPCMCWGQDSIFAQHLETGNKVRVIGRLQSREGKKQTYYEVSVQNITKVEE